MWKKTYDSKTNICQSTEELPLFDRKNYHRFSGIDFEDLLLVASTSEDSSQNIYWLLWDDWLAILDSSWRYYCSRVLNQDNCLFKQRFRQQKCSQYDQTYTKFTRALVDYQPLNWLLKKHCHSFKWMRPKRSLSSKAQVV